MLGNYLYIDGGEFSQLIDGTPDTGQNMYYCRQSNVPKIRDNRRNPFVNEVLINIRAYRQLYALYRP